MRACFSGVVMAFASIPQVIAALKAGKMVVLVDDENRENEGDLVCAAEFITPEAVNFMLKEARGLLCVAMTPEDCDRLQLYPQAAHNTAPLGTAFTISVDGHPRFGITTGVSAAERATTIKLLIGKETKPGDLSRPGHIFPLRARPGGVLERAGQTEGSVDLCRLAGLQPAGAIIEIMSEDGNMARLPQLEKFCAQHGLLLCTIADLIQFRLQRDALIRRIESLPIETSYGAFELRVYETVGDPLIHIALCCGGVGEIDPATPPPKKAVVQEEPVLVRMHSEHLLGDVFGAVGIGCAAGHHSGKELQAAMKMIQKAGKGAVVYLRQESRGLALLERLGEFKKGAAVAVPAVSSARWRSMDRRDFGIGGADFEGFGIDEVADYYESAEEIFWVGGVWVDGGGAGADGVIGLEGLRCIWKRRGMGFICG